MRKILTSAICVVMLSAFAPAARADVVADFWQGVQQAGYNPGDKIRVVFVTSPVIDAVNGNLSYYDSFGDGQASVGLITSSFAVNTEWRPLVTSVNNDINGSATPVKDWIDAYNIPVFNTRGELVKATASSMLGNSSSLSHAIKYDESGDDQAPKGSVGVWTGTDRLGLGDFTQLVPNQGGQWVPLDTRAGSTTVPGGQLYPFTTIGDGGTAGSGWLRSGVSQQKITDLNSTNPMSVLRSIYVMSGEITVVPEPTTLAMWLGLGGIAGLVCWRKRRKSS